MSRDKAKKILTDFDTFLTGESSFLTVFFYVSQNKTQNTESLIKFFQNNNMKVSRTCDAKLADPWRNFVKNANFVAQSRQSISRTDFEAWSPFLISHVIVVAFLYQNHIWNTERCRQKKKNVSHNNSSSSFSKTLPIISHKFKKIDF